MTKYEVKADRFEIRANGISELTAQEIFELYESGTANSPTLLNSCDSMESAQSIFEEEKYRATTRAEHGFIFPLIVGTIVWIEQNEYDEDGEFLYGGDIIEFFAEPYNIESED